MKQDWPPAALRRDWLDVGDGHRLHLVQYGLADGIPLLYLHGGPGAGCCTDELKLLDLSVYRVVMVDQRGTGRSHPRGELTNNNLLALLADLERVRVWLDIPSWCLAGGSFGATLGLLYSGLYPHRVLAQVLWGLFIPSDAGIHWLYGRGGAARIFAKEYASFQLTEPGGEPLADLFRGYRRGFQHPSAQVRLAHVRRWLQWELALAYPGSELPQESVNLSQVLASIELYYVTNAYFGAYELMCQSISEVKADTLILQGEMDWVCHSSVLQSFITNVSAANVQVAEIKGGYHALADVKMSRGIVNAIQEMARKITKEA